MKKLLIILCFYSIKVSACGDEPMELNFNMFSDNKDVQNDYQYIDDSLYSIWKNNLFVKYDLAPICGCVSGGYILKSSYEINNSFWFINFCSSPDSLINLMAPNDFSPCPAYVNINKNTKLYKSIIRLKSYSESLRKKKKCEH
jgi:hypothetical protein